MNSAAAIPTFDEQQSVTDRKPPASERYPRFTQPLDATQIAHRYEAPEVANVRPLVFPIPERLLNAREVAARLGVSERWVRDHTTRRSPKIRGVKLGPLMRYRVADVDEFLRNLLTSKASQPHSL